MVLCRLKYGRLFLWMLAIPILLLLLDIAWRLIAFIHLFGIFGDHAGIRSTQVEIALAYNNGTSDPRPLVVPKILHHIFHNWHDPGNDTLPPHWEAARQTCIDLNPDWAHKVCEPVA